MTSWWAPDAFLCRMSMDAKLLPQNLRGSDRSARPPGNRERYADFAADSDYDKAGLVRFDEDGARRSPHLGECANLILAREGLENRSLVQAVTGLVVHVEADEVIGEILAVAAEHLIAVSVNEWGADEGSPADLVSHGVTVERGSDRC